MIGAGLRLTRRASPATSARAVSTRMERTGPRSPCRTAGAATPADGRTASRGAPIGCARTGLVTRRLALVPTGRDAVLAGGDTLALPFGLAAEFRRRSLTDRIVVLAGAMPFWSCRRSTRCVAFAGVRCVRVAGSVVACGVRRSTPEAVTTVAGAEVSSTGSEVRASDGVGSGDGVSALTGGGGGATTGGSGAGEGETGAGSRAGSRPSGSTYPFGSASTRTPRWTCGCRVTVSLLSPIAPTGVPSVSVLPRSTLVAPSWSNVTA
jgi:hypothetical protein